MKLFNTLKREVQNFTPLTNGTVRIYSCGPTVYDQIHIGNLSSFIVADTLHRTLAGKYQVQHVMNFTDVDDKTIARARERYPDMEAKLALKKLTTEYETLFISDMKRIGNGIDQLTFIRATDTIDGMQTLITQLHNDGFAYIADDGVYFSIEKYRASGKIYGQLLPLTESATSDERINNDEYDKDSVHDFALWKTQKGDEPAWEFTLDGKILHGRPGWHIECSAMSAALLGQPFDIHTGGVDLLFPHHENEIAQSTAGQDDPVYASVFVHNEHLLIDGKKMSKSLKNFFTLEDIVAKGFEPLAFRLMVLQSQYRSQSNFTWESLQAAQNRLRTLRQLAELRFQDLPSALPAPDYTALAKDFVLDMENDLRSPSALKVVAALEAAIGRYGVPAQQHEALTAFLELVDQYLGLDLLSTADLDVTARAILSERAAARAAKDWAKADALRDQLLALHITVRDTDHGQIWARG